MEDEVTAVRTLVDSLLRSVASISTTDPHNHDDNNSSNSGSSRASSSNTTRRRLSGGHGRALLSSSRASSTRSQQHGQHKHREHTSGVRDDMSPAGQWLRQHGYTHTSAQTLTASLPQSSTASQEARDPRMVAYEQHDHHQQQPQPQRQRQHLSSSVSSVASRLRHGWSAPSGADDRLTLDTEMNHQHHQPPGLTLNDLRASTATAQDTTAPSQSLQHDASSDPSGLSSHTHRLHRPFPVGSRHWQAHAQQPGGGAFSSTLRDDTQPTFWRDASPPREHQGHDGGKAVTLTTHSSLHASYTKDHHDQWTLKGSHSMAQERKPRTTGASLAVRYSQVDATYARLKSQMTSVLAQTSPATASASSAGLTTPGEARVSGIEPLSHTWDVGDVSDAGAYHRVPVQYEREDEQQQQQQQDIRHDVALVPEAPARPSAHNRKREASPVPLLAPAMFSMTAVLSNQDDIDCLHQLRTTLLTHARGKTLHLTADVTTPLLTVCNVERLIIVSSSKVSIESLYLNDVDIVMWHPSAVQRAIQGDLQRVRRVTLNTPFGLHDIAALAGVPEVHLCSSPLLRQQHVSEASEANVDTDITTDLSPLLGASELEISDLPVAHERSVFDAAQRITLSSTKVSTTTLANATSVKLLNVTVLPGLLHLPKATDIRVIDSNVNGITCPARINRLYIHSEDSRAVGPIPAFEHANLVHLSFLSALLSRSQLADLGGRADVLALEDCVKDISDLQVVPDHVSVHVRGVNVDAPAPPCVKKLQCRPPAGFQTRFVAHVPRLTIDSDPGAPRIRNLHLLSKRQQLSLRLCPFDKAHISDCKRLLLWRCVGTAAVASVSFLEVESGVVASEGTGDHDNTKLHLTHVRDVSTCRLELCHIEDFACMQNVRRLVLGRCTFDSVDNLPPVDSLVVWGCTMRDETWSWPKVVLTNRSPEEMRRILLAGKRSISVFDSDDDDDN